MTAVINGYRFFLHLSIDMNALTGINTNLLTYRFPIDKDTIPIMRFFAPRSE
jgi:hypothetical protein